jgi:hypothetical protein
LLEKLIEYLLMLLGMLELEHIQLDELLELTGYYLMHKLEIESGSLQLFA